MADEFEATRIDIHERAKGPIADFVFGARINQGPLAARKRQLFVVGFQEILTNLGTD